MIADPEYDDWLVGDDRDALREDWVLPPIPKGALVHPPQHGPFALGKLDASCYERTGFESMLSEMEQVIGTDDPLWRPPHSERDHDFDNRAWLVLKAWSEVTKRSGAEVYRLRLGLDDKAYQVPGEWAVQDLFIEYVVVDRARCELVMIIALIN